jgi:hypothetical protein
LAGLDPYLVTQLNPDPVPIRNTGDGYHTVTQVRYIQNFKIQCILYLFKNKTIFSFVKFMATKEKAVQKNCFPSFLFLLDPGIGMEENQDLGSEINIPDPQHWMYSKSDVSLVGRVPHLSQETGVQALPQTRSQL